MQYNDLDRSFSRIELYKFTFSMEMKAVYPVTDKIAILCRFKHFVVLRSDSYPVLLYRVPVFAMRFKVF